MNTSETVAVFDRDRFPWAEQLSPRLLKSPWWIGHIPFAYEVIGRQRPNTIVELGTYSGSSFAAFCQAVEAFGLDAKCYGVDLWQGDIHMGRFEEDLSWRYRYMASTYPTCAAGATSSVRGVVSGQVGDLLHIDATHTFEGDTTSPGFRLSDCAIVLVATPTLRSTRATRLLPGSGSSSTA